MGERIGFYGCSIEGRARLVRIGWEGEGRAPRPATVAACPVCGCRHKIPDPCWRWPRPRAADRGRDVELHVVESGAG